MMQIRRLFVMFFILCLGIGAQARERQDFNFGWKFLKGDPANAQIVEFDDSSWKNVDLPHDWSIEYPFKIGHSDDWRGGYAILGTGWYRKTFNVPVDKNDQKVLIEFDGIYKNCTIWLNGSELGKQWYGYAPFYFDLTPHITWGADNVLAVKVDTPKQTCRWYSGSGIYRNVRLVYKNKLAVDQWGSYVSTPEVTPGSALVKVQTDIINAHSEGKTCTILTTLLDAQGQKVGEAKAEAEISGFKIPGPGRYTFSQDIKIKKPKLWSADTPILYTAKTVVTDGKETVDEYSTSFGVRTIEWVGGKGFVVNGEPTFLNGINIHHDLGGLGAAWNARAMERRLELLKEMGCNSLRMAHNPPASELLDMCDRMGFYVIDEAFDKWGKERYATFEQDWPKDLEVMIRRDRNHPSVVLWSLGNENWAVPFPKSKHLYNKMVEVAKKHDDTRKFTYACSPGNFVNDVKAMDVASLNYHEGILDNYIKEVPEKVIIISESYSYWSGKDGKAQAFHPVNPTLFVKQFPQVSGTYNWTGIEYLGEAKAKWPQHGWNGAPIDTCAIRKPVAYLQQSLWSDKPMVHIAVMGEHIKEQEFSARHWGWPGMLSHWTHPDLKGKNVKITTFSNCDEVELFVNDKSQGKKKLADFADRMICWTNIPYTEGTVKAVGFKGGKKACTHELKTAGAAKSLKVVPDRTEIEADGYDVSHLVMTIVDESGVVVPDASHKIKVEVAGPGKLRALDNGNLYCQEPYFANPRSSYQGRNMAIVQAGKEAGEIKVKVSADGLESADLVIKSK